MDIQKLVRENIKTMKPYSSARDEFKDFDKKMIFLDANENPFENGVNRYPDPKQQKVKTEFAKLRNVNPDTILLGNGSDEVLDLVFRAFCEPNKDNIITLPPTYGMYAVLADLNAIENREVLLNQDFQPNVSEILKKIDEKTKIIFFCSPNNPTGNCITKESILEVLTNFNGLVIIDEAYIDFSNDETWINSIGKFPNLIVTQTLSKAYGMAGIRMGILYANEAIIQILDRIKPPYNISDLTQNVALKKIMKFNSIDDDLFSILSNKSTLIKELLEVKFVERIYPSDANFILIKVDDADLRYKQLIENGIVVRNRSNQPLCENCIRITIGTERENYELIETFKGLQNG